MVDGKGNQGFILRTYDRIVLTFSMVRLIDSNEKVTPQLF